MSQIFNIQRVPGIPTAKYRVLQIVSADIRMVFWRDIGFLSQPDLCSGDHVNSGFALPASVVEDSGQEDMALAC